MKAVCLTAPQKLETVELPNPEPPGPREVLIRMGAVGICGSDIHYYKEGRIGSQVIDYPFTIGHECAGTIEAVGADVTRLKPGNEVAIEPAVVCGACDQCRAGREHTCRRNRFLGCPGQLEGALSEYLLMPEENCFPLRSGTSAAQGTLSEPLAIGVYTAQLAQRPSNGPTAILGAGPIGLSVLFGLKALTRDPVYFTEPLAYRRTMAQACGADEVGAPNRARELLDLAPHGLDTVIECCGQQEALDQALELLKPGGTLMIVGIPATDRVSFSIDQLRRKEIRIQNVRRQTGCVQKALDLIESGIQPIDRMVTHTFALEHTPEAFDLTAGYKDGIVKAMIQF